MEDDRIVALYLARDESALQETKTKYEPYLLTVARNIVGSREDSEECVNDAYLGAWNSIPPQQPRILSAYLAKLTAVPLEERGMGAGYLLNVFMGDNTYSFGSGFTDGYIFLNHDLADRVMFRIDNYSELESEFLALEQEMGYTR